MPLRIEAHEEPIPGYRLIDRLGSGGFGEVWKAEAPGGLYKAIKFVQRESKVDDSCAIGNNEPDRSRADQEMKSLSRVKTVHHPYVISLDRFEIVDDYLVIVMELADRTLADRFKQCRSQGLPGLPREELLSYLQEAGEALDLMNSLYQLQHLDIKPQNLFLVHNHIKVADFGLVKDITDQKFMTITGGVTPVYAAPETFDGKFSRQSDQYSLAIVYQEMLTGLRPFTGTTMKQLILQHLQNSHDLSPAPVHDRPIIARALSKNPEDRFATCEDFVKALRRVTLKGGSQADTSAPAPLPSDKTFPSVSKTQGARGKTGPVKPVDPNFSVAKAFLADDVPVVPPPPPPPGMPSEQVGKTSRTAVVAHARKVRPLPAIPPDMPGIVQPALVVGIGQLGVETLSQLRQRLAQELGSSEPLPHIRLVAIDTDPASLHHATNVSQRAALKTQETLLTRLQRPSHYLKTRDGKLPTDSWLNPKHLYRIPRDQNNAGIRALGRLAFVDNYRSIAKRLETELQACCSQDTAHDSDPAIDLGLRTTKPRVYLVTSLTGCTGSGMFLDVAYLLRKLLNDQGHGDAEIVGLFYLPAVRRDASTGVPLANAYASLVELQHYCKPEAIFSALYETAASAVKGERVTATGPAVQRCMLLPLPDVPGRRTDADNAPAVAQAGDFLYRDLATTLGQSIDEQRLVRSRPLSEDGAAAGFTLQSIGMYRIHWPRYALLEQGARKLAAQLVTRWMSKDAKPLASTIQQWTQERWESLGLRPENLIERFQQLAEHAMQRKPEQLLAEILVPVQEMVKSAEKEKDKGTLNLTPVVETMDRLERVLGIPEETRSPKQTSVEPSLLERSLAEIALVIADECEQKLAELAVTLLEDPNYRLAGAEEALRQFCTTVEQSLSSQETLAKELAEKAAQLNVRIHELTDRPISTGAPSSTQWTIGFKRRAGAGAPTAADIFDLVRTYTKTRFHSLVLTHLNRLYLSLRGHLSDQIREVGFCRQRLGELLDLLKPAAVLHAKEPTAKDSRALFPPGCLELSDAVAQLSQSITHEDLLSFDDRIQAWITAHCQALLQVCMGSSTTVRNLAPAMLQEAELFLSERLQGTSVAEMYLTRQRSQNEENAENVILDDLEHCLDEATPAFGRLKDNNEITIVTLPNDAQGLELQEMLRKRLSNAKIVLSDRQDEIVFYHEIVNVQWKDVEQLGPIAMEIYQQRGAADPAALHTREDVFEWSLIAANNR